MATTAKTNVPASSSAENVASSTTPLQPGILGDISSPHELTDWVELLLNQLESRFDDMSGQVAERMTEMSSRINALENSIQDLINGTAVGVPASSSGSGDVTSSRGNGMQSSEPAEGSISG